MSVSSSRCDFPTVPEQWDQCDCIRNSKFRKQRISNDWRGAISSWLYHITRTESFLLCWACFIRACKQLSEDNVIFKCLQPSVLNHTCVHFWSINSLKFSDIISSQISWFLYTTRLKKTAFIAVTLRNELCWIGGYYYILLNITSKLCWRSERHRRIKANALD